MVAHYSVIQHIPDPIADERLNIGIVVFNEEQVEVEFLNRWDRVRCFGGNETNLRDFAEKMHDAAKRGLLFPGDQGGPHSRQARILKISEDWINGIQFTEPRGSIEDVDPLMEKLVKIFLREPEAERKSKFRDRQEAARITRNLVRRVVQERCGRSLAKELVQSKYSLAGSVDQHTFDVAVANGKPLFAAHGLSFEIQPPETVRGNLVYMISDVKETPLPIPIAVITLPPQAGSTRRELYKSYEKMSEIYRKHGADVLLEEQVRDWVSENLEKRNISGKKLQLC